MAAPTPTTRTIPTGYKMPDGWQTTIAFLSNNSVQFWEKTVKSPGIDGGDAIDTTTMLNAVWRTRDARHLKTLTEVTGNAAWDPNVYTAIVTLINKPDSITVTFPDNAKLCFYGYLRLFDPEEMKEGEMPMIKYTIICTNWDPVNFVEAAPLFTASGTA